jgi:hypothetical protein
MTMKMGSKEYIDSYLKNAHHMALSGTTHRIIKSTSFLYFWSYEYLSDAKKIAAALRRRGYSATILQEVVHGPKVMNAVYFRDWGMGKRPKPDWRKRTGSMVAPAPRKRKKS